MRDKIRKIITGGIKSGTTGLISPLTRILLHHRIRILFRTPDKNQCRYMDLAPYSEQFIRDISSTQDAR